MDKRLDYCEHQLRSSVEGSFNAEVSRAAPGEDQRQLELKLEKSLALVRATLESTTDGILVIDEEGHVDHSTNDSRDVRMPGSVVETRNSDQTLLHLKAQYATPGRISFRRRPNRSANRSRNFFEALKLNDGRVFGVLFGASADRQQSQQRTGVELPRHHGTQESRKKDHSPYSNPLGSESDQLRHRSCQEPLPCSRNCARSR